MALTLFLLSRIPPLSALPLQSSAPTLTPLSHPPNTTTSSLASPKVGWTSTPQIRGTADLLISCLTTLSLCAWTAYHPNVHRRRSEWHNFGHRAMWMGIAVLVPEVVLFCAWEQWVEARRLREYVNRLGEGAFDGIGEGGEGVEGVMGCDVCQFKRGWEEEEGGFGIEALFGEGGGDGESGEEMDASSTTSGLDPESIPLPPSAEPSIAPKQQSRIPKSIFSKPRLRRRKTQKEPKSVTQPVWTTQQAHFALSGGFAIPSSTFSPHPLLTFTPYGIRSLARLGLLPRTSHDSITDKSKADYIAKVLVCVQAGWFVIQCLARLCQKLPLTLLEVHVLTHVGCAVGMYGLWWGKPYDVGMPVVCEDERVQDLGALWGLHVENEHKYTHDKRIPCCVTDSTLAVTPAQVVSAHTYLSSQSSTSHSQYIALIKSYFDFSSRSPSVSQTQSQPQPDPTPNLSPKAALHLDRANRALSYLSRSDIHDIYLSNPRKYTTNPTSPDKTTQTPSPISPPPSRYQISLPHQTLTFPSPLIVPFRSNLRITGTPHIFSAASPPVFFTTANNPYTSSVKGHAKNEDTTTRLLNVAALLSILYGCAHLAAWDFDFASETEMWFWRASGIVMVGMPVGIWAGVMGLSINTLGGRRNAKTRSTKSIHSDSGSVTPSNPGDAPTDKRSMAIRSRAILAHIAAAIWKGLAKLEELLLSCFVIFPASMTGAFGMALYPVARMFVLVEVFAALRASHPDVYKTVEWTNYIPHAG